MPFDIKNNIIKVIVPYNPLKIVSTFKCGSKIRATTEKRVVRRRPEFNYVCICSIRMSQRDTATASNIKSIAIISSSKNTTSIIRG